MQRQRFIPLALLTLALSACGGKDNNQNTPQVDPAIRERIRAWMTTFDQEEEAAKKAYGITKWVFPGEKGAAAAEDSQLVTDAPCDMLALASKQPVGTGSAGGRVAQVKALWLYAVTGCAGTNINQQSQTMGTLESARRALNAQWNKELAALPESVQVEAKAGERAKKVAAASALGVNEYQACMLQIAGKARENGSRFNQKSVSQKCNANSTVMDRYDACPIDWAVVNAHAIADRTGLTRDGDAWVGDATARFRMAWRGCDDNSFSQWQAFIQQVPPELREGRLKRIAAVQDPLMACQFQQFRKLLKTNGPKEGAFKDYDVIAWCGRQLGLQYLSSKMAPPRIFTDHILNDDGRSISWLYDPAKASLRPDDWKFTPCMLQVAQKMAQEGHNLPEPDVLANYCKVKNGKVAKEYLSGQSIIEGRAKLGPAPE